MDLDLETAFESITMRNNENLTNSKKRHHQVEVLHLFRCSTHTHTFTHKRFYTQTPFTHRGFYTQMLLHTHTLSYTEAFTHRNSWRVSLNDIFWSWTQTVLFLTSSTWWHRALLQTFADISLTSEVLSHVSFTASWYRSFWAIYVGFSIIKWNNMCHTQHHGTELCCCIFIGCWFRISIANDGCGQIQWL